MRSSLFKVILMVSGFTREKQSVRREEKGRQQSKGDWLGEFPRDKTERRAEPKNNSLPAVLRGHLGTELPVTWPCHFQLFLEAEKTLSFGSKSL